MVHVVSYDLQRKHCIFERLVEVIIGFDTGDPSGCTQSNQRLLSPVFRMLILDDGSQLTVSLGSRRIVSIFLKNGLSGVVSYNHLYFSPPLSNFKGGSFEPFEPPLLRAWFYSGNFVISTNDEYETRKKSICFLRNRNDISFKNYFS